MLRVIYLLLLTITFILSGCGGKSSSSHDIYAETIFWEEEVIEESNEEVNESVNVADNQDDVKDAVSEEVNEESNDEVKVEVSEPQPRPRNIGTGRIRVRNLGRLADIFNDSNYLQLQAAQRIGITPVSDLRSCYRTRRPIVEISSNKDFMVEELTHSFPYLVPQAAQLLHDIGRSFRDSVAKRGGADYRVIVTSVFRTPSTVKRLTRVNRNAVTQSTHQYATTFDITYSRFDPVGGRDTTSPEDLKNILAEVIYDYRNKGRCLVKYERKSPCFHITAIR